MRAFGPRAGKPVVERGLESYAQLSTHERRLAREDFTAHGRRIQTSDLERSVG